MSREDALAEFIRHQLHPLAARDELSRHFRIFNWEAVRPTTVYRKLLSAFRAVKEPQARGATFALGATEAGGTLERWTSSPIRPFR